MTEISFYSVSRRGGVVLDSTKVLLDSDGNAWLVSGAPSSHGLKPADDEELAAIEGQFGALWRDAVAAVKALA